MISTKAVQGPNYNGIILFFMLVGFAGYFSRELHAQTDKISAPYQRPAFLATKSPWADSVFQSLSPDERIAQLFMVAAYSGKDELHYREVEKLVSENKIGGLIFFKGNPTKQAALTNRYQSASKTPLFIAIDAEWGLSMRLDSTVLYPRQMMLGAIQNDTLIYRMGQQIAKQCRRMGIQINFAPVIDINNNAKNPVINNRSFGEVKELVARLGLAYMKGMQDNGIIACGKHFPGHGDTDMDSHKSLPTIPHGRARLDSLELYPFKELIREGLASMMVAHLYIPSLDSTENMASTLSPKIVTGLLKNELGFEGLIFTDALNMKGVSSYYAPGEVDVKALLAGNDILLFAENVPLAISKIKAAVSEGKITQEEIDKRCLKILKAKEWAGLNKFSPVSTDLLVDELNLPEYEVLNHQLAKQSLTLIKNDSNLLPLKGPDTVKTVYLNIGGTNNNAFIETLKLYGKIDQIQIPRALSAVEEKILIEKCRPYSRIIIGFHRTNNNPKRNFGVTLQSIAIHNTLAKDHEVVTALFGNPYVLESFGDLAETEAFVVGYQDSPYTNSAAAQLIFGGLIPHGKLPVSGSHYFPAGTGLTFEHKIRLGYVLPGEIGVDTEKLKEIDQICESSIRKKAFPGCQVVAIKDGEVFYNKSFGYHTYEKTQKVRNDDLYDLASVTKIAATTIALIKLQKEGLIDIDKRLTDYIPEWVDSTRYERMVIREMLAHQAGLQPWIPFYTQTLIDGKPDPSIYSTDSSAGLEKVAEHLFISANYDTVMLKKIVEKPLRSKTYKYSDLGYYFLKAIIEKQTGMTIDQYTEENFYKPMGLIDMTYYPLYKFPKDRITPTEDDDYFRHQLIWGNVHDMGAAMQGGAGCHAGLFSNALDLATLMYMLINDGNYGGVNYLDKDTISDFTRCQFCPKNRRGAGFDKPVRSLDGGPTCDKVSLSSFGHSGFTGTLTWADPDKGIVYVFLSNRVHPDAENWLILSENVRTRIQDVIYTATDR